MSDWTLSGPTTPDQSGPGSNSNEEVLHIPQSSIITVASPSDCLASYPEYSLGESYSSAKIQLVVFCSSSRLGHTIPGCSVNETNFLLFIVLNSAF